MIDFRYHLVSIISIFLALAAGIALGAGPLKGQLGDQLQREIGVLTADKASLNAELEQAKKAAQQRDNFVSAAAAPLLTGRLRGAVVDVVVLPGADAGLAEATIKTLTAASSSIGTRVTVKDNWFAADTQAERTALGDKLVKDLGLKAGSLTVPTLDQALAAALQPAAGDAAAATKGTAALAAIADADLASFDPANAQPATAVVIVAGPVKGDSPLAAQEMAAQYATLGAALDGRGRGSIMIAETGVKVVASGQVDPLAVVRADSDIADVLSTVDDAGLPMGQVSVVLGLLEQATGSVGHYGLGVDTTAAFPANVARQ